MTKNIRRPARDGADVVLTIDRNIQAATEKALVDGAERTGHPFECGRHGASNGQSASDGEYANV